jgi:hypothetical protein
MEQSPSPEANTHLATQEIPPLLMEQEETLPCSLEFTDAPILSQMNDSIPSNPVSLRLILIHSPNYNWVFQLVSFLQVFDTNFV